MPELPEVETIINDLRKKIIAKKIIKVDVFLPRIIMGRVKQFLSILINNKIKRIERRGKLIIIELQDKNIYLLIHLLMTGQLVYCAKQGIIAGGHSDKNILLCKRGKFTRIIFRFADKSELFFNDARTFGRLQLAAKNELEEVLKKFGKEALAKDLDAAYLKKILKNKKASIKAVLLDQKLIAGIGNIYADESLFMAGIFPGRAGANLKESEIKLLRKSIKQVLQKAIKHRGTTFNNYVDAAGNKGGFVKKLNVYGRAGQKCRKCGRVIKKIKVAQRGTSYCDYCQK